MKLNNLPDAARTGNTHKSGSVWHWGFPVRVELGSVWFHTESGLERPFTMHHAPGHPGHGHGERGGPGAFLTSRQSTFLFSPLLSDLGNHPERMFERVATAPNFPWAALRGI